MFDVSTQLFSKHRHTHTGVLYHTSKPAYEFFETRAAEIQCFLDKQLPGRFNLIVSHSHDESRYAVLCVNFRGSTGYGRKFEEAGFGQWGLTMQDDVTDGLAWAVPWARWQPVRLCIHLDWCRRGSTWHIPSC